MTPAIASNTVKTRSVLQYWEPVFIPNSFEIAYWTIFGVKSDLHSIVCQGFLLLFCARTGLDSTHENRARVPLVLGLLSWAQKNDILRLGAQNIYVHTDIPLMHVDASFYYV